MPSNFPLASLIGSIKATIKCKEDTLKLFQVLHKQKSKFSTANIKSGLDSPLRRAAETIHRTSDETDYRWNLINTVTIIWRLRNNFLKSI